MKILVPLKPVLDPAGFVVNRRAQKVFVNREQYITNPADRCALEAALQLAEAGEVEIVAASVGPARNETALREALALGASAACRVDLDNADEAVVARALARLVEHLGEVDLVLLGEAALDTGGNQVGPRLAEEAGWPFIGSAWNVQTANGAVVAVQHRQGDWVQVRAGLPAVVSFPARANRPRLPHGARLITAFQASNNVSALTPADLGLTDADLEPAVEIAGRTFPPRRESGHRLEGSLPEIAATLAASLQRLSS